LGRHNVSTGAIFVVYLLFGWTGIGWILTLVWALVGCSWDDHPRYYYPIRYY
jgi:TM2 domain-containing membrane protein YozV